MIAFTQNAQSAQLVNQKNLNVFPSVIDFNKLISPETALETKLMDQIEFKQGFNWGVPRFGHPEGKVGLHVKEVLDNIDLLQVDNVTRQRLRLTALAHDTFKYLECESKKNGKKINHGILARRYMEKYIEDEATLNLIELHDEIYYAWRHEALHHDQVKASSRLENLEKRIGDNFRLHYLFFRSDTMTGDKIQAPRYWIEQKISESGEQELSQLIKALNI